MLVSLLYLVPVHTASIGQLPREVKEVNLGFQFTPETVKYWLHSRQQSFPRVGAVLQHNCSVLCACAILLNMAGSPDLGGQAEAPDTMS